MLSSTFDYKDHSSTVSLPKIVSKGLICQLEYMALIEQQQMLLNADSKSQAIQLWC